MRTFRDNEAFFREHDEIFRKSDSYAEVPDCLPELLLLGDRMLVACDGHPDIGRATKLGPVLQDIARAKGDDEIGELCLKIELEPWLKALLWLVRRDDWVGRNEPGHKHFNLFKVFEALGLFPANIKDLQRGDESIRDSEEILRIERTVDDPVEQHLLFAKQDRNQDVHGSEQLSNTLVHRVRVSRPLALIAALYRHREALRAALSGLITRELDPDPPLKGLLGSVAGDRSGHLGRFGGRKSWLTELEQRLSVPDPTRSHQYLLLTATEGSGKSAMAAMLSQTLSIRTAWQGKRAGGVRRHYDWLPGVLLHMGKCGSDPVDIARSLIAQANTMLLDPVEMPRLDVDPISVDELPTRISAVGKIRSWGLGEVPSNRADGAGSDWSHSAKIEGQLDPLGPAKRRTISERCRWALQQAMSRLVAERGSATLILDAIDEIDVRGEGLPFMPHALPPGCTVLITGRPGKAEEAFRNLHLDVEEITLEQLTRPEIPLITGVPDDSDPAIEFNNAVLSESQGWALSVSAVGAKVKRAGGHFDRAMIGSLNEVLLQQAERWQDPDLAEKDRQILELLQPLLAIFEPCCPLPFDALQGYLENCGVKIDQPLLESCLRHVGSQLLGLETQHAKLGLRPFADYCRTKRFSARDLRRHGWKIAEWLAEDDEVAPGVSAAFLGTWMDDGENVHAVVLRRVADRLLDLLTERRAGERLWSVHKVMNNYTTTPESSGRVLRLAADCKEPRAMLLLGLRLIGGDGVETNPVEGEKLLRQAIEGGNTQAMSILGSRFCDGDGVETNPVEGEKLLRQAIEGGNTQAMSILGSRFCDGDGVETNPVEGEKLLRQAIEGGNTQAMGVLGNRFFDGDGIGTNPVEGEKLLRQAIEGGDAWAMGILGHRFFDGGGVETNPVEGEKLLRQAIEGGNTEAMGILGDKLYVKGDNRGAASFFLDAVRNDLYSTARSNLAYMLRRGEVPDDLDCPPIEDLLAPELRKNDTFSRTNQALALAAGFGCNVDWEAADEILRQLQAEETSEVAEWGGSQAEDHDDPEGHLVVGWLAHHGLLDDPDGWTVGQRMQKALEGGWAVPAWLMR